MQEVRYSISSLDSYFITIFTFRSQQNINDSCILYFSCLCFQTSYSLEVLVGALLSLICSFSLLAKFTVLRFSLLCISYFGFRGRKSNRLHSADMQIAQLVLQPVTRSHQRGFWSLTARSFTDVSEVHFHANYKLHAYKFTNE